MNDVGPAASTGAQSQQLVDHLTQLSLDGLGAEVVREARMRLIDGLGCGLYAAQMPWSKITADVAYSEKSLGNATVLGRREPIAPARAALCNGTATHGIELDDVIEGAHVHPGSVVIPTALAVAEHGHASGGRLLLGVVAGYETMARVGRAIGEAAWGFHLTGIAGPVASAVTAGVILELSCQQIMRAVGIACSSAGGIKAFTQGSGGMIKRLHAGRAAESGILAGLLAQRGFTAPTAAIDGRFGLLEAFGGDKANTGHLVEGLGQDYAISRVWTKVYPCSAVLHTTAQALKALRDKHNVRPQSVKQVRVGTNHRTATVNNVVSPQETMAAQYSMPYAAAVALVFDPKDPRSFEGNALNDPMVRDLLGRVEVYADAEMQALYPRYGVKVEVLLDDGTKLAAQLLDAHGSPSDPCSESEAKEKFCRLARESVDKEVVESILDIVEHIEQAPSVAALSAALRRSAMA